MTQTIPELIAKHPLPWTVDVQEFPSSVFDADGKSVGCNFSCTTYLTHAMNYIGELRQEYDILLESREDARRMVNHNDVLTNQIAELRDHVTTLENRNKQVSRWLTACERHRQEDNTKIQSLTSELASKKSSMEAIIHAANERFHELMAQAMAKVGELQRDMDVLISAHDVERDSLTSERDSLKARVEELEANLQRRDMEFADLNDCCDTNNDLIKSLMDRRRFEAALAFARSGAGPVISVNQASIFMHEYRKESVRLTELSKPKE